MGMGLKEQLFPTLKEQHPSLKESTSLLLDCIQASSMLRDFGLSLHQMILKLLSSMT
jgi:hypothetical protein